MFLDSLFYKKRYIKPFIANIINQYEMDNAVFFCDYDGKNFLMVLCIKDHILEVKKVDEAVEFFSFYINETNFQQWTDYKDTIIKIKELAHTANSKHLILLISENIRHISNQAGLSFHQTKDIINFFLQNNQAFFINNSIVLDENMNHSWID